MSRDFGDTETCLQTALAAVNAADRDELPDYVADDVDRAALLLLKASQQCDRTHRGAE